MDMRLKVMPDGDGGLKWSMVASREDARPLVDGVRSYPDVGACCRAAAEVLAAPAASMLAVQQPSGEWRWSIQGDDGGPLAISSSAFDTAAACGHALHLVRHDWLEPTPAAAAG
jgi:hypothetical protein